MKKLVSPFKLSRFKSRRPDKFRLAASSELIRFCQEELQGSNKLLIRLGLLGSWLGSAGIVSPLITVSLELWLEF